MIKKITFVYQGQRETPRFTLEKERSYNGAPSVTVEFSDGYKDTMILKKFYANADDRMANKEHCNYIGHLANELEACVAMTGCVGSDNVEFTILSTHASESSMFKWSKGGNVEVIKTGFEVNYFSLNFTKQCHHFILLY